MSKESLVLQVVLDLCAKDFSSFSDKKKEILVLGTKLTESVAVYNQRMQMFKSNPLKCDMALFEHQTPQKPDQSPKEDNNQKEDTQKQTKQEEPVHV